MSRSLPASWLFLLFLAHVSVWTLYGVLSNPGAIHHDMMEAYVWGHEYQLGYYKHPPFWAWLAGAWFDVFPRSNWAFYLLAALNSGFALFGVWRLYGLYAKENVKKTGVLLLLATPLYTFLALKFNANAMLLSLFPWTVYFFAVSIETASLSAAALLGVFAAACMLSKYYSALLLFSIFVASLLHPNAKRYYSSFAPYLAAALCLLLLVPHASWMLDHGFQTVKYAQTRTGFSDATVYKAIPAFIFGSLAFFSAPLVLGLLSKPGSSVGGSLDRSRLHFLGVLAFGPFALSVLSAFVSHVRLSTNFAIPIFFLVPLLLIQFLKPDLARLQRFTVLFVAGLYALILPIAFAVPHIMALQKKPEFFAPVLEAVEISKARWAAATQAPIRTVAGSLRYGLAAAFYGDGEVKELTNFDYSLAPWITPERLAKTGLLGICLQQDGSCVERATALMTPASLRETVTISHHYGTAEGPPYTFELFIIPPR